MNFGRILILVTDKLAALSFALVEARRIEERKTVLTRTVAGLFKSGGMPGAHRAVSRNCERAR